MTPFAVSMDLGGGRSVGNRVPPAGRGRPGTAGTGAARTGFPAAARVGVPAAAGVAAAAAGHAALPPQYPQQPYPQQGFPQPGHPLYQHPSYQPGMLGAAHKPGAIPLRPLQLGDIYDAAFRIIRFNPKATVGSAVLVTAVAMLIPVLVTAVLTLDRRPVVRRERRHQHR